MVYIYKAEIYCNACGKQLREETPLPDNADPHDETTYDSDDYPKRVWVSDPQGDDNPVHCASGSSCIECVDLGQWGLSDGAWLHGAEERAVGKLLSIKLSPYGVENVRQMLSEKFLTDYQRALHRFWKHSFAEQLAENKQETIEKLAKALAACWAVLSGLREGLGEQKFPTVCALIDSATRRAEPLIEKHHPAGKGWRDSKYAE